MGLNEEKRKGEEWGDTYHCVDGDEDGGDRKRTAEAGLDANLHLGHGVDEGERMAPFTRVALRRSCVRLDGRRFAPFPFRSFAIHASRRRATATPACQTGSSARTASASFTATVIPRFRRFDHRSYTPTPPLVVSRYPFVLSPPPLHFS